MKKNSIQDIVNNFEKIPPDHCWKAIENKLNLLSIQGTDSSTLPESQTTSISSGSSSKIGSFISKMIAAPLKVAAITGSVALISVVSYFLIKENDTTHPSPSTETVQGIDSSSLPLSDSVIHEDDDLVIIEESTSATKHIEKDKESSTSVSQEIEETRDEVKDPLIITPITPLSNTSYNNSNQISKPQTTTPVVPSVPSASISASEDPVAPEVEVAYSTPLKLTIPNIFTPNGDGYNDYFVIEGIEQCENPQLVIKSMNGRIVYKSANYQNNWDGDGLPDGVYLFYFLYKINNIEKSTTGKVILKR